MLVFNGSTNWNFSTQVTDLLPKPYDTVIRSLQLSSPKTQKLLQINNQWFSSFIGNSLIFFFFFFFFIEFRDAESISAYYGYPKLWILRYPAHRYHAVPSPGFEPTTLWLRVTFGSLQVFFLLKHPLHTTNVKFTTFGTDYVIDGSTKMQLTYRCQ
jgi:hypothetical protein